VALRIKGSFFIQAWAWVGYGYTKSLKIAKKKERKEDDPYKIIVSRSHAGEVQKAATESFGANSKVLRAGGAGKKGTIKMGIIQRTSYVHTFKKCNNGFWYILI
jgi:hypothetical protein